MHRDCKLLLCQQQLRLSVQHTDITGGVCVVCGGGLSEWYLVDSRLVPMATRASSRRAHPGVHAAGSR